MDLGNVSFVLHRPSSAENIGSVARAMKNFGLFRLGIVAPPSWAGQPRGGGDGTARDDVLARARTTARHAAGLLDAAAIHADAREALATMTWTCGTTSREASGRRSLTPRELAREIDARSVRGPVAVLFGEERRGLSDAELDLCAAVCTIPTSAAYDSMNLAHAAAVLAYELATAAPATAPGSGPGSGLLPVAAPQPGAEPARHATLEALWELLRALLAHAGYLNPQNPDHILGEWRRLLTRAEPTQREAELLVAAARALARKLGQAAEPGRE